RAGRQGRDAAAGAGGRRLPRGACAARGGGRGIHAGAGRALRRRRRQLPRPLRQRLEADRGAPVGRVGRRPGAGPAWLESGRRAAQGRAGDLTPGGSMRRRVPKLALAAVAAVLAALVAGAPADAAVAERAWVQLTDRGAEARLATTAPDCPAVVVDSRPRPMQRRAAPSAEFPATVCQAPLPKGARTASIEGRPLPLPAASPRRIVIFGDTGCRLKGKAVQAC